MPKYTFEIDGQKYTVTSDTQPTKEELLNLVDQQQPQITTPQITSQERTGFAEGTNADSINLKFLQNYHNKNFTDVDEFKGTLDKELKGQTVSMRLGTFGIDDKTYILPTYAKGIGKILPVETFIQDIRDGKIIGYETKDEAEKQLSILRNTIVNKETTGFVTGNEYESKNDNQIVEQKGSIKTKATERLTEETIKKDPKWIEASKKMYEWNWTRKNPGKEIPKLSDQGYAEFGLEYGGGLAYSDVDLVTEGQAIGNATDEQKQAFVDIIDMYDEKAPSFAGAGRAFANILNPFESPTTYLGVGAGKIASTAAKEVVKNTLKQNILKSIVTSRPGRYAIIGSAEGAAYGGGYESLRQRAKIRADAQEKYKSGDIAEAAGVGTVFGGVLGGTSGVIINALKRRKKQTDPLQLPAPEAEIKLLENISPEVKPLTKQKTSPEPVIIEGKIVDELEDIVSPLDQELRVVVNKDVGILGKIPYIGNIYKRLANNVLNKIESKTAAAGALGDLPEQPQYLGKRGFFTGKLERVSDLSKRVFNSFNKLTPDQNKTVYEFLTGSRNFDEVPENLKENALNLRQGIDRVSEILEENGLLSKEIMEENYGTYLPRLFLKYFNKKSSPMGYLKERKDLDEATRLFLGEIEDVGLLGAKAIEDPISDVVKLGFFKEISKNPNWAVQETLVPFRGRKIGVFHAKEEVERITKEIAEGLRTQKEIPQAKKIIDDLQKSIKQANTNIAKLDQKKFKQIPNERRYGELRGMYVRKEIYDDLIGANRAAQDIVDSFSRFGRDATKIWKTLKVPLNPPSVVRNFISNMVLLNLSGVSATRLPLRFIQAFEQIINKGKYYKIANKFGISSTTFNKQEMVQIKRMYKIAKAKKTGNWLDRADSVSSLLLNFAGDSYGFIETFGKIIKIIDDMEAGKNAETAVYNAQKTLFDYSLVPPRLRQIRQSPFGVPFATFQYKVLPFLIDTFIRYPERYVKYAAVPALAALEWKRQNKDMTESDLETLKESLQDYLRDSDSALVWPYKDDEGRWQFYDWSYNMPWGFYSGIINKIESEKLGEATDDIVGLWGGPGINVITAIQANKDPFTNREIVNPSAPPVDKAADSLNYVWRTVAPTWLTDIGFAGKMYEAITKEPNYYGDPKITQPQAWWRLVGQNFYPVDPEQSRDTNLYFKGKEINDLQQYYRQKIREASLRGDEQKVLELERRADEQINILSDAYVEYEEKSKLPERLKRKKEE